MDAWKEASTPRTRERAVVSDGHWIEKAIKHKGALHRALGVPQGQKIPKGKIRAAAKKGGKLGRRARLAETLEGMHQRGAKKLYGGK